MNHQKIWQDRTQASRGKAKQRLDDAWDKIAAKLAQHGATPEELRRHRIMYFAGCQQIALALWDLSTTVESEEEAINILEGFHQQIDNAGLSMYISHWERNHGNKSN